MCCLTLSALLPTFIATSLAIEGGTPSRRTVESILLKIPLPTIWLDNSSIENNTKDWYLLSHHRLIASISNFIDNKYCLKGLDFSVQLEGQYYSDLERYLQRRILETKVNVCLIPPEIPLKNKDKILKKIVNLVTLFNV